MGNEEVKSRLKQFLSTVKNDLDRCMDFWINSSHDESNGGFLTCLSKEGEVYDDLKYAWLQCRQVWMYARLYNELERYQVPKLLKDAEQGGQFLIDHIKNADTWKCYFLVTKDGKPVKTQRTIFAECFYLMAMSELSRATQKSIYYKEALGMLEKLKHWVLEDDTELGNPKLEGQIPTNSLAVPMMMLCVADNLMDMDSALKDDLQSLIDWSVKKILAHIQRDGEVILENVTEDGQEIPGSAGRLTVPGHVIEAGWFLLKLGENTKNETLKKIAIETFIVKAFGNGWDKEHGGLFYFLDVDGWCPTQLEWSQKLWWPHNEAMIAFLMAYKHTRDLSHLQSFQQVFDYSYSKFVDETFGEWYGYLNRDGSINMDFKGGPFKGCFHVPRCLLMCEKLLEELISQC